MQVIKSALCHVCGIAATNNLVGNDNGLAETDVKQVVRCHAAHVTAAVE